MTRPELPYVVVLAGGEGQRLAPLTRALYGTEFPKQFAVIVGERSLLQATLERAKVLTTLDRISVVITAHHQQLARLQLAAYPGVELIVQPKDLDTGPGMLLPLVRLLAYAAGARVVFLPSDHHVADAAPITQALTHAALGGLHRRIALVGATPTGPEVDCGWIQCGTPITGTTAYSVRGLHEQPTPQLAETLWRDGGLWNTAISTGPADALWSLAKRHLPGHIAALERYAGRIGSRGEAHALNDAYAGMASANFGRDVLGHTDQLAVVPVSGSGWSDWGSPRRVFASLAGTAGHDRLLERLSGAPATRERQTN